MCFFNKKRCANKSLNPPSFHSPSYCSSVQNNTWLSLFLRLMTLETSKKTNLEVIHFCLYRKKSCSLMLDCFSHGFRKKSCSLMLDCFSHGFSGCRRSTLIHSASYHRMNTLGNGTPHKNQYMNHPTEALKQRKYVFSKFLKLHNVYGLKK